MNEQLATALVIILILTYGILLAKVIPSKFHIISNISVSVVAVFIGFFLGLTLNDLGLQPDTYVLGIFTGLIFVGLLAVLSIIASHTTIFRKHAARQHSILKSSSKEVLFQTSIRIPLSTTLMEEILFRGLLFGLLASFYSVSAAFIVSSVIFGLWHIFPAYNSMNSSMLHVRDKSQHLSVIGHVVVTFLAGIMFSWLRYISGSLIAPWIAHWAINAGTILTVFLNRYTRIKQVKL